jgi:TonB family protein
MAQKLVVPITFKVFQQGALVGEETVTQDVIKVGRDQKSHLRIDDDGVKGRHAVIEARVIDGVADVQIIDLGSGTQVNGQAVNKAALRSGDRLVVGSSEVEVTVHEPRDAAQPAASVSSAYVPPVAAAAAPSLGLGGDFGAASQATLDGDELYQLIKRGDINTHEVEDASSQVVEVSVLWKSAILHVAHVDGGKSFVISAKEPEKKPAAAVMGGLWGVGSALMLVGAAKSDPQHAATTSAPLLWGGIGAAVAMAGSGAGIFLAKQNEAIQSDVARFTVGPEVVGGAGELPVVVNGSSGRFVFLPGATGEVDIQGVKRSLDDLKAQGHARPSSVVSGGFEVNLQPDGRYRQEVGGLTIIAKVTPPGRVITGAVRVDRPLAGAIFGTSVALIAMVLVGKFAISDDSGLLSSSSDDDRLAELRAFIQRQQERQPEQQPQQQANDQQEGGTGTRHRGDEGKMGKRDAPSRNNRYAIKNNNQPPHLSREAAREAVNNRGVFAALGAPGGGMAGGQSGIVSPFGALTESGVDDRNANGNMTGDNVGDAFGYGGLGATGTGWGGGGSGEGTIGMGGIGTMGHGSGTGSGQGYGSGAGRGLRSRGTTGPTVRAAPPTVSGLLSPEAIRRVVLRNLGQVNRCYEQGLSTNPNIAGRVVIRFVIGATGTVMASSVGDSSIPVPSVGECVANAVRRWQFPSPEGGGVVTVNYPFNLQPADQ